jgi:hypothetical protein
MVQSINVAVEGLTDLYVVESILESVDLSVGLVRGQKGKNHLVGELPRYNQAANFANWVVILDLDQDAECAAAYVQSLLPTPATNMKLRIAVRAIEAWLMTDREHFSKYLNIAVENVPSNPDDEANPKTTLLDLVRRSRKTALHKDMLPREGSGRQVGEGYVTRIAEFVNHPDYAWRPNIAAENSDSLKRCLEALRSWKIIE